MTELFIKEIQHEPEELINLDFSNQSYLDTKFGWSVSSDLNQFIIENNTFYFDKNDLCTLEQDFTQLTLGNYKLSFDVVIKSYLDITGQLTVYFGGESIEPDNVGHYEIYAYTDNPEFYFSSIYSGLGVTNIKIESIDYISKKVDTDDSIIPITYQLADIIDFTKRNAAYTKTINIPGSPNNNELFRHIYDINTEGGYTLNKGVPCFILNDTLINFNGYLEIIKIYVINNNISTYDIQLYNNVVDLYKSMGDKLLTGNVNKIDDLDFSKYNHSLNVNTIRQTFTNDGFTFSGELIGGQKTGKGFTYIPIDKFNKWGNIVSPTTGLTQGTYTDQDWITYYSTEMTPCLYINEMMEQMASKAGYTIQSNFMLDTDINPSTGFLFNSLIYPFTDYKMTIDQYAIDIQKFNGDAPSHEIIFHGGNYFSYNVLWKPDINGTYSIRPYDESTGIYSEQIGFGGEYNISVLYTFMSTTHLLTSNPVYNFVYRIGTYKKNIITNEITTLNVHVGTKADGYFSTSPLSDNTNQFIYIKYPYKYEDVIILLDNEILYVNVQFELDNTIDRQYFYPYSEDLIIIEKQSGIYEGNLVPMNQCLHTGIKQVDLFKSVVDMFNLRIDQQEDVLIIEPYEKYYELSNDIKVWTNKTDTSTITIERLSNLIESKIDLKYDSDDDLFNVKYNEQHKYEYGELYLNPIQKTSNSLYEIKLIFAPAIHGPHVDTTIMGENGLNKRTNFENVKLFKINDGNVDTSAKFKPRILQYRWVEYPEEGLLSDGINCPFVLHPQDSSIYYEYQYHGYPFASHLNIPNGADTFDLMFAQNPQTDGYWANVGQFNYIRTWVTYYNLFEIYYRNQIDSYRSINNKLVTAYILLNTQDINELSFNNLIFIDKTYYKLNKIYDYIPNTFCKVELIKITNEDLSGLMPPFQILNLKSPTLGKISFNNISTGPNLFSGNDNISGGRNNKIRGRNNLILGNNNDINGNNSLIIGDNLKINDSNIIYISGRLVDGFNIVDGCKNMIINPFSDNVINIIDGGTNCIREVGSSTIINTIEGNKNKI